MSAILFQRTVRVSGVLTDADSTPTISIVRLDSGATVLATTSTGITNPSTGRYAYELSDPVDGVRYKATWTMIVNGQTVTSSSETTAGSSDTPATGADAIVAASFEPRRVSGDSGSVEMPSIQDQIAADKYARGITAGAVGFGGVRHTKLVPPGAADVGSGRLD